MMHAMLFSHQDAEVEHDYWNFSLLITLGAHRDSTDFEEDGVGIREPSSFLPLLPHIPWSIGIDYMHVCLLGPFKECYQEIIEMK